MDLVSRKWLATIVSAEETSTQIVFTDALETEGLMDAVLARADGLVGIDEDDEHRPILLAISDNGGADDLWVDARVYGLHAISPEPTRLSV